MSWGSQSTIVPPEPAGRPTPPVRVAACLFGVAAFLFSAANTVFTTLDSYAFATAPLRISFWWLAIAASSANFLFLICLGALLVSLIRRHFESHRPKDWTRVAFIMATTMTMATSISFSLTTFILKATNGSFKAVASADGAQPALKTAQTYLPVEFAMLGASIAAQFLFFILSSRKVPIPEQPKTDPEAFEKIRESMITQARQANILMSFGIANPPATHASRSPFHSPSHSLVSLSSTIKAGSLSSSLKSPRPSATHAFQSATHRARNIRRKTESDVRVASPQLTPPQEDGFDTWDTSSVDQQTRDAVMGTPRLTTPSRLDPIPGSLSNSPVTGNFELITMNLPEGTLTPSSYSDDPRSRPESALEPPAPLFTTLSRPASPSGQDQSHIHPLFRSESPGPFPKATPATVITAAPASAQVISAFTRPDMRSRSKSQPAYPAGSLHPPDLPSASRNASPSIRVRPSVSSSQLQASPRTGG